MNEHMRISDADRDRAAADLAEHFAQGRIDAEEHAERLDAIWTARTGADLAPIFADLPRPAAAPPPERRGARFGSRPHGRGGWHGVPFLPVVALLVVLSVVTHLPFWILIFVIGCGLFKRRTHAWR